MSANGDAWFQHPSDDPLRQEAKAAQASIDAAERWTYGCPTCGHDRRDITGLLVAALSGGVVALVGVTIVALIMHAA